MSILRKAGKPLAAVTALAAVLMILASSTFVLSVYAETETGFGKLRVKKVSALPSITDGNLRYSLALAMYTLYEDESCEKAAKLKSGEKALLTTNEDGMSDTVELEAGTYYMKETRAPAGYAIDTGIRTITVKKDMTTTYTAADVPKSNPVDVLLQKADAETGTPKPQGGAYLEGAEYTVTYYDDIRLDWKGGDSSLEVFVAGKKPAKINGQDAVWVFRTDKNGQVRMSDPDKYLVKEKSAPLYKDAAGRVDPQQRIDRPLQHPLRRRPPPVRSPRPTPLRRKMHHKHMHRFPVGAGNDGRAIDGTDRWGGTDSVIHDLSWNWCAVRKVPRMSANLG